MTGVIFAALMALGADGVRNSGRTGGESVSRPVSSAKTRKIVFDVYRQGKPFGQHEIVIAERGEEQSVAVKNRPSRWSRADYRVRLSASMPGIMARRRIART
jgi:hypothetical protein